MNQKPTPAVQRQPQVITMRHLFQILLALLAAWTFVAGVLVAIVGGGAARVLTGVEDNPVATHLIGAHFLLIAPVYVIMLKNLDRYRWLVWFPFAAQAAVLIPALYDVFAGDRDFADAVIPILISTAFLLVTLAAFVYRERGPQMTSVRPVPGSGSTPGRPGAPPSQPLSGDPGPDLSGGRFKRTIAGHGAQPDDQRPNDPRPRAP